MTEPTSFYASQSSVYYPCYNIMELTRLITDAHTHSSLQDNHKAYGSKVDILSSSSFIIHGHDLLQI